LDFGRWALGVRMNGPSPENTGAVAGGRQRADHEIQPSVAFALRWIGPLDRMGQGRDQIGFIRGQLDRATQTGGRKEPRRGESCPLGAVRADILAVGRSEDQDRDRS
jgi:hypothetical protein